MPLANRAIGLAPRKCQRRVPRGGAAWTVIRSIDSFVVWVWPRPGAWPSAASSAASARPAPPLWAGSRRLLAASIPPPALASAPAAASASSRAVAAAAAATSESRRRPASSAAPAGRPASAAGGTISAVGESARRRRLVRRRSVCSRRDRRRRSRRRAPLCHETPSCISHRHTRRRPRSRSAPPLRCPASSTLRASSSNRAVHLSQPSRLKNRSRAFVCQPEIPTSPTNVLGIPRLSNIAGHRRLNALGHNASGESCRRRNRCARGPRSVLCGDYGWLGWCEPPDAAACLRTSHDVQRRRQEENGFSRARAADSAFPTRRS